MSKLRAYQRTAIESARRALTKSGSCVLQMPTGAGKTRAASEIIATTRGVIWFVCHRQEIERQAAKAFAAAGIDFGIVSPRGELQPKKRVQIISVNTNPKNIKKLPSPKLVIWDECHHAPAGTWARLRRSANGARHLGLTATPERLDGKGLKEWFSELVTGPCVQRLIDDGYLSRFKYYAPSDPDLTNAKLQAGDYRKADMAKVMNTPVLIGDAVREYRKNANGKRAIAFCATKEAARDLAAKFCAEGIPAKHVHDKTPATERDAAIDDLASGRIRVLTNVEVFTEGFNLPAIDAVILMRPTKSPTLLLQMIGRGLRKAKGKDVAIIMDHAGLHREHWFADPWEWSLDGGAAKARRAAVERGPRRCPECKEVRAERVEVCDCGYEFPTGREIGEFDGVLTEVRGVVPEGCVTRKYFADKYSVSKSMTYHWERSGMPTVGAYIPLVEASKWVGENTTQRAIATDGFARFSDIASALGASSKSVEYWVKAGMPRTENGLFDITACREWLIANPPRNSPPLFVKNPERFENRAGFARRTKFPKSTIQRFIKMGMPTASNGWVEVAPALAWIEENANREGAASRSKGAKLARREKPRGFCGMPEFADRHSVGTTTVKRWINRGMPSDEYGIFVHTVPADRWVADNVGADVMAAARKPDAGTERITNFAKRFGVGHHVVARWIKRGMPADKFGKVIVAAAIKWVSGGKGNSRNLLVGGVKDPDEYVTQKDFAKLRGFKSQQPVLNMIRLGMPCSPNNKPHLKKALEWCRVRAKQFKAVPPLDESDWWEYESCAAFARRIGVSASLVSGYWRGTNIPTASNGWVHIQRGLEWVRDNTDIVIPKSAWPKKAANDNARLRKAA